MSSLQIGLNDHALVDAVLTCWSHTNSIMTWPILASLLRARGNLAPRDESIDLLKHQCTLGRRGLRASCPWSHKTLAPTSSIVLGITKRMSVSDGSYNATHNHSPNGRPIRALGFRPWFTEYSKNDQFCFKMMLQAQPAVRTLMIMRATAAPRDVDE